MKTRYFYRHETDRGVERRFAVAYRYNFDTGEVEYGASVFRKDTSKDVFVKASHRQTAEERLGKRPVRIAVEAGTLLPVVEDRVREAIRSYGVRGTR